MRYLTRALYIDVQDARGAARVAWNERLEELRAHTAEIRSQLPPSVGELLDLPLHDSVVLRAVGSSARTVELTLGLHRGQIALTFRGVVKSKGLEAIEGESWLYEEVYLHPEANFELHVLFENVELEIAADALEIDRSERR